MCKKGGCLPPVESVSIKTERCLVGEPACIKMERLLSNESLSIKMACLNIF